MTETRISRREFLKLLGLGATVFALGGLGLDMFSRQKAQDKDHRASGASAGSWSSGPDTLDVSIHAALLKGNKVFYVTGSGFHSGQENGPFTHAILDPATNSQNQFTLPEDLFCCGMATLENGNILIAGGTSGYDTQTANGKFHGLKSAYEVDFNSGSVTKVSSMAAGRWYPTLVTLPDGKVFVVQGWDEFGCNNRLVEIYDPSSKTWSVKLWPGGTLTYCVGSCATDFYPEAGQQCYGPGTAPYLTLYPRMHLMPNGLIIACGMGDTDRVVDPSSGRWYWVGTGVTQRHYGTSVLLPLQNSTDEKGKILVTGGSPDAAADATNTAEIIEPSGSTNLTRRSVQSMTYARKHVSPVILPTGQVVIFGGNKDQSEFPVFAPEAFDPETETWSILPPASVPRMYHSVALLLQDGRVWNAGTTASFQEKELRTQIFSPDYVSETRPTISGSVTGGAYGDTITIPTPDAANITKVSLVRVSSTTHHYNTDQRLIWLPIISAAGSSVKVSAPINNKLAPPGMYLVHIINGAGVPSVGAFIKIPGTVDEGGGGGTGTYTSIYKVTGTNSYLKLYTTYLKRAGEMTTPTSVLIGKSVKKVSVVLKKSGSPTGIVSVVARKGTGDTIDLTFGTIDASTLTTSDQTLTFEAPSSHTFADNDKILVEWDGTGNSTDQVWMKRYFSSDASTGFDDMNTKQVHMYDYKTSYNTAGGGDLVGEWFSFSG